MNVRARVGSGQGGSESVDAELLVRLRSMAVEYVRTGWSIVPVSPAGDRLIAGLTPPDPATAFDWWSDQPYGIGCRLGEQFDALEIPADLGARLIDRLRRNHVPNPGVIDMPGRDRWLFLVTPGTRRIMELTQHPQVQLYTTGSWIPLPPTRIHGGEVRWVSQPDRDHLTHSLILQWMVRKTLWRQVSRSHDLAGDMATDVPHASVPSGPIATNT